MFKKIMLSLSCVSLLALVACGEDSGGISTVEPDEDTAFEFKIEMISDDELAYLDDYIELNYTMARDGFITEGLNLLFNFNQSVTNFSLIEIEFLEDGSFVKTGILYEIGYLEPNRPLVITHYTVAGTMPTSGFHFTGPAGIGEWFTLHQSQMDGSIVWHPFNLRRAFELIDLADYLIVEDDFESEPDLLEDDVTDTTMPVVELITPFETLGETIVTAGMFWEEWWNLSGRFAHTHLENDGVPAHLAGSFSQLLPTSGFERIDDIRDYLLQYYTKTWVDSELFGDFPVFVEYDEMLYIEVTRAGFPRPNWESATHLLIELTDSHVIIETTILWGSWHRESEDINPWEVRYHFTFVNERINHISQVDCMGELRGSTPILCWE